MNNTSDEAKPTTNPLSLENMYEEALVHARAEEFDTARAAFQALLAQSPDHVKAWISWAQMEKRQMKHTDTAAGHERCRGVLLQGLEHNIDNPKLLQSLGLLELQTGRKAQAVPLLEKAAALSPACQPVLNWKAVREAREELAQEQFRRPVVAPHELLDQRLLTSDVRELVTNNR